MQKVEIAETEDPEQVMEVIKGVMEKIVKAMEKV